MSEAICVENLSKKLCRSLKKGMLYTAGDVGRDLIGMPSDKSRLRPDEFWSLKDVSFTLKRGEAIGLIGHNGAGKSTLLKVLNGIIRPDTGRVSMKGRVGALIEVGAGFHPQLTGRENIYVNGAILGMTKNVVDKNLDSIIAFSGLIDCSLDAPVKTYSSGMYVRLGFAIAIHSKPDILLVDEVLSVADGPFRARCADWLANYARNGGTLILVSHYLSTIRECCSQALFLENGVCKYFGATLGGIQAYQNSISRSISANVRGTSIAESQVRVVRCQIMESDGDQPVLDFDHDQPFKIAVKIEVMQELSGVQLHITFAGSDARTVCGWSSRSLMPEGLHIDTGNHTLEVDLGKMPLIPGSYAVLATLSDRQNLVNYHEFVGPSFIVREHAMVDSRFGQLMLKGDLQIKR